MLPQVLLALVLFACVPRVFAARSMMISGNTSSLIGDDILVITASPSGFVNGELIYIKGAFFQSGTSNYFGFTKNGDSWIKNSANNASQRSVKIGEWDGTLQTKVDYSDSGYKGENDYLFKLRFYYGSSFTSDWSANELSIGISEPDPTITPLPTATNTASPTQIIFSPTPLVTPTRVPESTASPIHMIKKITSTSSHARGEETGILGVSDSVFEDDIASTKGSNIEVSSKAATDNLRSLSIALAFIASGFALLSAVTIWHNIKTWAKETQNKK